MQIARETLRQERASVRRTQQNHLRHMEENAAETQRLQRQCSQLQASRRTAFSSAGENRKAAVSLKAYNIGETILQSAPL